jgi:D-apionolactonase
MTVSVDRLPLLHGSDAPLPELRELRAGPARVLLDGVDVRYVRIGRTEVVRRIYAAVRDRNWNTIAAAVSDLEVDERDDSFEVRFRCRHTSPDVDFSWEGTISGDAAGRVVYVFDGRAERELEYNRIGICVHHPWRETAGQAFRARTPEGELDGSFPSLIGVQRIEGGIYHPLFPSFDRLELQLAGAGSVLHEFEGDLWETEDHRNWTDANFKTYSTPIGLGFPHRLGADEAIVQKVTVTPSGIADDDAGVAPVRLTVGGKTGTVAPAVGLGQASDGRPLSDGEVEVLSALAPAHLRVEAWLDRSGWEEALVDAKESAGRIGCALELSLHLRPEHAGRLPAVAAALADGPAVDRVLVILAGGRTSTPEETTPPELVDLVRGALGEVLPAAAFVGGTEIYFTEINRTRPQAETWDGVCYSITPQVHAFTDLDLVENLDAQAETVRSARVLAGGKPVVVSPITIRRRVNFHATTVEREPPPGELPDPVDVRQPSLLGAAWTAGSLKYVSEAGAASVTYYETAGWRGVVEHEDGSRLPEKFHCTGGQVFPLYHPLADVAGWRGAEVLECGSDDPLAAVGLCVRADDGAVRLLVANVTARQQDVVVGPLPAGTVALRRLSESTAERAGAEPEAFRSDAEHAETDGELALRLGPYEVVRIDCASQAA